MEAIDIRAAIERAAPGAKWHWAGGPWDDYSQLVWEDEQVPKPTLKHLQDAWQSIESDKEAADNLRQTIRQTAQSTVGQRVDQLDNNQIKALLVVILWQRGAVANDLTINPLADWTD